MVKRVHIRDDSSKLQICDVPTKAGTVAKQAVLNKAALALRALLEGSSKGGRVLVCCKAGLNRSVAVCLAYGIKYLLLPPKTCFQKIVASVRTLDNRHCEYLDGQRLLSDIALQVSCFTLRVCPPMMLATL